MYQYIRYLETFYFSGLLGHCLSGLRVKPAMPIWWAASPDRQKLKKPASKRGVTENFVPQEKSGSGSPISRNPVLSPDS